MRWLDLAKHNAALWLDNEELAVLPIDAERPIEGVNASLLTELITPPGPSPDTLFDLARPSRHRGALKRIGYGLEGEGSALWSLRVSHDIDGERLPVGVWMQLFPEAVPRDTATMATPYPPILTRRGDPGYQWLWRVIEPEPAMLDGNAEAFDAAPAIYAFTEEDARRYGNAAQPITADETIPYINISRTRFGLLWGNDAAPALPTAHRDMDQHTPHQHTGGRPANADAERRTDWGEKIGGARKDTAAARARIGSEDWERVVTTIASSYTIQQGQVSLHFDATSVAEARRIARKPKRDWIWPTPNPVVDYERGQSPLGHWLAARMHEAIAPTTTALRRATTRDPGTPIEWVLLGGGYTAQVEALRERFETPISNAGVIAALRESLEELIAIATNVKAIHASDDRDTRNRLRDRIDSSYRGVPSAEWFKTGIETRGSRFSRTARGSRRFVDGELVATPGRIANDSAVTDIGEAIVQAIENLRGHVLKASICNSLRGVVPLSQPGKRETPPYERGTQLITRLLGDAGVETPDLEEIDDQVRSHINQTPASENYKRHHTERQIAHCETEIRYFQAMLGKLEKVRELLSEEPIAGYRRLLGDIYARDTVTDAAAESNAEKAQSLADNDESHDTVTNIPSVRLTKQPVPPRYRDLKRDGVDRRFGVDVTEQLVAETFGLRAIEYGHWVNQAQRQAVLNLAYDSLDDMAEALGVQRAFMGFNGTLALAFGARGRGGRVPAHYEPARQVINLTKTMGAGTLAHEWSHALDHWLCNEAKADLRNHSSSSRGPEHLCEFALTCLGTPRWRPHTGQPHHYLRELAFLDETLGESSLANHPIVRASLRFTQAMALTQSTTIRDNHSNAALATPDVDGIIMDWRRRMFRPVRLRDTATLESFGGERLRAAFESDSGESASKAEVQRQSAHRLRANWQQRMTPFVNALRSVIIESGGVRTLCDKGRGGRCVFSRERLATFANKALLDENEPTLSAAERAFFDDWLSYKDFRWLDRRVRTQVRSSESLPSRISDQAPTQFLQDACALEQQRTSASRRAYWNSGAELFARGFSTVIHQRMADKGVCNDFAARYSAPGQFGPEQGYTYSSNPEGNEARDLVVAAEALRHEIVLRSRSMKPGTAAEHDTDPIGATPSRATNLGPAI